MATLIADRFLFCGVPAAAEDLAVAAIDLASGDRVNVQIAPAGGRDGQQAWAEACARAYGEGRLVDFGFLDASHRFEAALANNRTRKCATLSPHGLLEWLEHSSPASRRVLYVDEFPDMRELRLRGFVLCELALLEDPGLSVAIWPLLAKRSVLLLNALSDPGRIAMAILRLRRLQAREVCVLALRSHAARARVEAAAESRASYGRSPSAPDARVAQMTVEADRLLLRGRHAAARRVLRGAIGAFERRGDWLRAGDAALTLGKLLLARGRALDAKAAFEQAHTYFQRGQSAARAIAATIYVGLAQTDLRELSEAEQTCRAARSAATALRCTDSMLFAGVGLARNLLWQERYADARSILESTTPAGDAGLCVRYWCLVARLRNTANALPDAWRAVERARPMSCGISPELESVVRLQEASVQARIGDLEAVRVHVTAGLAAARSAHLPLQTIKLKLVHIEGLVRASRSGPARMAARHLHNIREGAVPPLLGMRIQSVLKELDKPPAARESEPWLQMAGTASGVTELDELRNLLALSHQAEDETSVLARAATAIRQHTHAAGVGIFGAERGVVRLVGGSGSSSEPMAQRAVNMGQPIAPERHESWVESAIPVEYLGRSIGAMVFRWAIDGPAQAERMRAFGAAAAAVCAPLVYVAIERCNVPAADEVAFDIIGVSQAMSVLRTAIARAANAPFTVLIEGESGTGKELVARALHRAGCRRDRRFLALNCAAMPEDLVDAELFGHAKGAFTGATGERLGLFESADGGTVFLDEIGELSARAQAKVLRVLQEGEVRRVGEHFTRSIDARLVAATNRPLRGEVEARRFRQDLLYRLDVIRIQVPPLRDRAEDIPLLASRFWKQAADRIASRAVLGQSALSALARYDWPGNVRELQNVLTALVVAAPARGVVGAALLPSAIAPAVQDAPGESLEHARLQFEQRFVRAALARAAGHRGRAAVALGLSRQGLAKLMQRLHLDA